MHRIQTPLSEEEILKLRAGDRVLLSGRVLTARDAAHKRMVELLNSGEQLPFEIKGQVIYYVGPAPAKPGQVVGSAGPTTSRRMDKYVESLLKLGLKGMIGKGNRSKEVRELLSAYKAVYFAAVGGVSVLLSKKIVSSELLAWEDLGTEAVREFIVEDFPLVVANDIYGGDLFEEGQAKYCAI
ncbi:MAG: Fe-S-containing hydro-lyase [Aquificaceae bacterium]|nr:Fe-S-containing hydro-lyase [Aquificaceae bacterium]